MLLIGLLIIGLGFAMYLPTQLRTVTARTFFYTAVGGALAITALCNLAAASRYRRAIFTLMVSGLVSLGLLNALVQHQEQYDLSYSQQQVMAGVIAHAPQVAPGTFFLIAADDPWMATDLSLDTSYLSSAFAFLYADYSGADLVSGVGVKACLFSPELELNGWIECRPGETGVVLWDKIYPASEITIPYARVAAFRLKADGTVELFDTTPDFFPASALYDPDALLISASPPPARAAILDPWPP